jgi:hypothetical protein
MKRALLICCVITACASMAFAGAGAIGVYSASDGTNCNFTDSPGGYIPVYMVHTNSTGATASEFMLVRPAGWTFLGSIPVFDLNIGTPEAGIAISYEACKIGSFLVYQNNYLGDGTSPTCSNTVYVTAAPDKPGVQIINCTEGREYSDGGAGVVNGDGTCDCNVPVEETTWGKVKALYQ